MAIFVALKNLLELILMGWKAIAKMKEKPRAQPPQLEFHIDKLIMINGNLIINPNRYAAAGETDKKEWDEPLTLMPEPDQPLIITAK